MRVSKYEGFYKDVQDLISLVISSFTLKKKSIFDTNECTEENCEGTHDLK